MARSPNSTLNIRGIQTAVPEKSLNPDGSAELLKHGCISTRSMKLLQRIARLTGIEKRHLVALDHSNNELANNEAMYRPATIQPRGPGMTARTQAFEKEAGPLVLRALSGFSRDQLANVQTLITVSCTHASSPGLERPILTHTPVPPTVDRWNLGFMGCSAGLAGVRLANQTAALGRECLVVTCELSSLHFQYTDELDQMTANVLFSDGAAAMVLTPEETGTRVVDCRCFADPANAEQMIWFAGDTGLQLRLSQELPETLAKSLPGAIESFLHYNGVSSRDVDHWLVHPGGPQILDAVEKAVGLPDGSLDHSRSVFREYGNMSSPTIFFIMKRLIESGARGRAVVMAFGPGLTIELTLLELDGGVR